eukprot:232671-Amphidinium_carterae.1
MRSPWRHRSSSTRDQLITTTSSSPFFMPWLRQANMRALSGAARAPVKSSPVRHSSPSRRD